MQEGLVAPPDEPREVSFTKLFLAICVVLFARKFLKERMAKHAAGAAANAPMLPRGSKIY